MFASCGLIWILLNIVFGFCVIFPINFASTTNISEEYKLIFAHVVCEFKCFELFDCNLSYSI